MGLGSTGTQGNAGSDGPSIGADGRIVAPETANGGNVAIRANQLLHLDRGVITASVTGGIGGNIAIDPQFVILENQSRIVANAGAG
jgi:hypothetical protein